LCLAGLAMSHTSEYIFGLGFIFLYLIIMWFRGVVGVFRNIVWAVLISLAVSSFYLTVFYFTFIKITGSGYATSLFQVVKTAGFRIAYLADFGIVLFVLLAGFAVWLFTKKKWHIVFVFGLYMLAVGYSNYIGVANRSFQTRFFWPVYLAVFLGLAIWFIPRFFLKKVPLIISVLVSIALVFAFSEVYYQPIEYDGLMNSYHWRVFMYVQGNAPPEAKVLMLYGDTFDQTGQAPLTERQTYVVKARAYETFLNQKEIPRVIESQYIYNGDISLAYRKSLFDYGYHVIEDNIIGTEKRDICLFDYYILDKFSNYASVLAQVNMIIREQLLKSSHITEVYSNELTSVLKNELPGEACFPDGGVRLE
ncbi:MAG: hypothetical protein ABIF10_06935, partial [Candidatus Woesearchaeota archaeon]